MLKLPWTLAIDPGLRHCGCALFEGKTLTAAWLSRNTAKTERGPEAWERMANVVLGDFLKRAPKRGRYLTNIVVEVPQVYWGKRGGGRASDLIELAGVVGAVSAAIPVANRTHYLPRNWKGTVPKGVHNARIRRKLSAEETAAVHSPSAAALEHNVIDGVGLGLFFLGRAGAMSKST